MFNRESQPTLQRIGRRLWRICGRLCYPHTHTAIVEESALESVLESADSNADSNAISPKIGLWVWAFRAFLTSAMIPMSFKLVGLLETVEGVSSIRYLTSEKITQEAIG